MKRILYFICCFLVAAQPLYAAPIYYSGFELGHSEPFADFGAIPGDLLVYFPSPGAEGNFNLNISSGNGCLSSYVGFTNLTNVGAFATTAAATVQSDTYNHFLFQYRIKPLVGHEIIFSTFEGTVGLANLNFELALNSDGELEVYDSAEVLVAAGTAVLAQDVWYTIEVENATGAAAAFSVKVNGVVDISGTANQGVVGIRTSTLGRWTSSGDCNSYDVSYDNYVYSTTALTGPLVIETLLPTEDGAVADWVNFFSTDNYEQVLEPTYIDREVTYIYNDNVAAENDVGFTANSFVSGPIYSVLGIVFREEVNTATSSGSLILKSGVSSSTTTAENITNTSSSALVYNRSPLYTFVPRFILANTDPATAAAWANSAVINSKLGVVEANAVEIYATTMRESVLFQEATPTPTPTPLNTATAAPTFTPRPTRTPRPTYPPVCPTGGCS